MESIRSVEATSIASLVLVFMIMEGMIGVVRASGSADNPPNQVKSEGQKLSHEQTLSWIAEHKAWRLAQKPGRSGPDRLPRTRWAASSRPLTTSRKWPARAPGCALESPASHGSRLARRSTRSTSRPKRSTAHSASTNEPLSYRVFKPRGDVRNWVAQVKGPDMAGFFVRPGYDPERPLYSPSGGYVIKDEVKDPYHDKPSDVWLVQQSLFESTYELVP